MIDEVAPANDDPDLRKIGRWLSEITLYERESATFIRRNRQIVKRFKDERDSGDTKSRLNMLWSMTQTQLPALYAKNPKPDIQRRFKDDDPVGRVTSDVLERCVTYFCDTDKFAAAMRQSVLDYLLPGRGTVWCRYVPTMRKADTEISDEAETEEAADEKEGDEAEEPEETIDYEDVETDYVHATDFGHNICRTWEECWLVWRRVYLDRAELVQRFGKDAGNKPPLDYRDRDDKGRFTTQVASKSVIYEVWDKKRKLALWLHKDLTEALDQRPDPLQLDGFFPCPKPLLANLANDSIIPTPDFVEYQDQAQELDSLTARIASITKSLKVAGVYDASAEGLERLLAEGVENQLIPVANWAMFAEKGGLQGAISLLPLKDIVAGLVALYEARKQVKDDLYEITGIADIIRGNSEAQETASAQIIKSQFATMRISDRQRDVQRFVRETIRIMVDVICGHFQIETIKQISGVRLLMAAEKQQIKAAMQGAQSGGQPPQIPPGMTQDQLETAMNDPSWEDVQQLIRNQPLRCFRIDIETDSTIKADEEAEKSSRIEFLKAAGGFLEQASTIGQQQPEVVPLLCQMLMFGVRAFPVGKELEGAFNSAIQKLEKQAASGQPKPNPEMMKIQGEMEIGQQKLKNEMELEQMRIAAKEKAEQAEAASQNAIDDRENQLEAQRETLKINNEFSARIAIAHIDAAAKIEVARIAAGLDSGDEAEAREAGAEGTATSDQTPKQRPPGTRPGDPLPSWIQKGMAARPGQKDDDMDTQKVHDALAAQQNQNGQALAGHAQHLQAITQAVVNLANQHQQLAGGVNALALQQHQSHQSLLDALTAEKELVRGKDGKATGVRMKIRQAPKAGLQ